MFDFTNLHCRQGRAVQRASSDTTLAVFCVYAGKQIERTHKGVVEKCDKYDWLFNSGANLVISISCYCLWDLQSGGFFLQEFAPNLDKVTCMFFKRMLIFVFTFSFLLNER